MSKNRVFRILSPLFVVAALVPVACDREDPISSSPMTLTPTEPAAKIVSLDAAFEEASRSTSFGLTDHIDCDAVRADLTERLRSVRINLDNTSNGFVRAAIQRQIDSLLGQLEQLEDECAGEAGDDGGFPDDSGDPNAGDDPGVGDDFTADPECERQANALRDRIA